MGQPLRRSDAGLDPGGGVASTRSIPAGLVGLLRGLRILLVEDTEEAVAIRACCRAACARCPSCGVVSARIHGAYARVVSDGAAGGRRVLIILAVRRFRCPDRSCAKATFAEQAEDLSVRYRRHSVPLLGMLAAFGLELGGRAGARLAGFTTKSLPENKP